MGANPIGMRRWSARATLAFSAASSLALWVALFLILGVIHVQD